MSAGSSGDFAWAETQQLSVQVKDCLVLIGWLSDRVMRLEGQLGMQADKLPELPTHIHGFGCYPRRDRAVMEARKRITATQPSHTAEGE